MEYKITRSPTDELYHYGVLGMKWGVRRYQNKDGSLTELGRKRLLSDPSDTRKILQKRIRKAKKKQYGWSNQWMHSQSIGPNSKAAFERQKKEYEKYKNSKAFKDWNQKFKDLYKKYDMRDPDDEPNGDIDKFQEEWDKLWSKKPRGDVYTLERYANHKLVGTDYLKGPGKYITEAYIKDLGITNEKDVKDLVNYLINAKYILE